MPGVNNVATVVIGPGEAAQCHQTDEFCFVHRIDEAFDIYGRVDPSHVRMIRVRIKSFLVAVVRKNMAET